VTPEQILRELLAVIHRDGGYYTAEHGINTSSEDAMSKVLPLMQCQEDTERQIVAWLRKYRVMYRVASEWPQRSAADAIERGEHRDGHDEAKM